MKNRYVGDVGDYGKRGVLPGVAFYEENLAPAGKPSFRKSRRSNRFQASPPINGERSSQRIMY